VSRLNGGLVRLREVLEQLNPSERIAAEYIMEHPEELIDLSVAGLAERSGSSPSAIIRLCKSMGLKGYQDLKIKVAGDLQQPETNGYQDIRPDDSIDTIIQHVSANNIQSIRDTVKILDAEALTKAVSALIEAKRIYFFGMGASHIIAQDAQQKFLRINRTSFSFADPHLQVTASVNLTPEDVLVAISYSGETKEVLASVQHAADNGARTIAITKYGSNTLSTLADVTIGISSTDNEIRSGAMASRIAQLNVIDILYLGVASSDYDQTVEYLNRTRKAIKSL